MHCPYCNRKPDVIEEYADAAVQLEVTPEDYVRMDEGTYDPKTNLFCCTDCYVRIGTPLRDELLQAFMRYRATVIEFTRR